MNSALAAVLRKSGFAKECSGGFLLERLGRTICQTPSRECIVELYAELQYFFAIQGVAEFLRNHAPGPMGARRRFFWSVHRRNDRAKNGGFIAPNCASSRKCSPSGGNA